MNIIRMTGGLGNQMFQYALYLKLKNLGRFVKMDDMTEYENRDARPIMLWCFDLSYPRASKEEINRLTDGFLKPSHRIRRKLFGRRSLEYQEQSCNFDEQILLREPAYLTGYFQSERYFKDIERQVRDAFTFSDKIWQNTDRRTAEKIRDFQRRIDQSLAVSVHIRRGDYTENEAVYGNICTDAYYKRAVEFIRKKYPEACFFVFSNEPDQAAKWIRDQYGEEAGFTVIEGTDENTGYLDLFLMSRCRHHILANSSFSWWGAWLNPSEDKTVIAPTKWFNNQECRDIYTDGMLKITPEGNLCEEVK